MAFHFQPQADSSDDEQVNLSAWQSGTKSNHRSTPPPASVVASTGNEADEDLDATNVSTLAEPAADTSTTAIGAEGLEDDIAVDEDEEANPETQIEGLHGAIVVDEDEDANPETEVEGLNEVIVIHKDEDAHENGQDEGREGGASNPLAVADVEDISTSLNPEPEPAVVRSGSHISPGFTSINKPALPAISSGRAHTSAKKVLKEIAIMPHIELDSDDEIFDFTRGRDVLRKVLKAMEDQTRYQVEFEDRHVEEIPLDELLQYENGETALHAFEIASTSQSTSGKRKLRRSHMSSTRPKRKSTRQPGFVNPVDAIPVSDDDSASLGGTSRRGRKRKQESQTQYVYENESDVDEQSGSDEERPLTRLRLRNNGQVMKRNLRSFRRPVNTNRSIDVDGDSEDATFLESDLPGAKRRKTKLKLRGPRDPDLYEDSIGYNRVRRGRIGDRQSGRSTRHQGDMQEIGEDEIYPLDSITLAPVKLKAVGAREQFKTLPRNDEFRMRHTQDCETCGESANFAHLIYCQGCTLAYHKTCIGRRNSREHLVTKVGDGDFILQCRRCIASARKKDSTAPDQGKCSDCHEHGNSCLPFRGPKGPAQEQKEREDNDDEDPTYEVDPSRINKASNVLFRCISCWRGFHFEHLPSRSDIIDMDGEVDAEQRFREYSRDWKCKECFDMPGKVSGLIAWKPMDDDIYDPGLALENIDEDEKAYLVKWEGMSYFRACWMPGAWVWGVTGHTMRKAFAKREDSQHPKMRTEDAIPEEYLRTDIVLDIKFTSIVDIRTDEIDKARIREVDKALIKYKGLGYEDAVWEAPPSPDDGDRWTDFVIAYNDWVLGRYVRQPRISTLKSRIEKARTQDFQKLEKKTQPENVEGGELMHYQIEGLNWLYYKWFTQKNCVLADEMGLGKTIQIIGFLATLVTDLNCFPFLVVVPNSTCPNWRREIKRWAPSLRVVAYYGSKESRDLAYRHEMFPEGSKELRCHIVVTSYDAAVDGNAGRFFRSVNWQGLVVDEGQRLKNDKNLLYSALTALKSPFRILLTGTPLQNNQRELFNLLHFLDDSHNAKQLEEDYAELDSEKIKQLHEMIRPFFLRRTKAQVLTFLPPMAQIIVPVSMTIVQKKLYRQILAQNPDLIKAIFSSDAVKQAERASLSNVLMQLRKCLCHPFVYSSSIEDRNVSYSNSHRNLVDASSKLKLLEILLPKLKERGHRVLIFSQFLDMLTVVEDVMDGMELQYLRLDGSINTLQKQKRIDAFNAPDSPVFAFLLSTRAGGVGINLASADTVIIMDPDFNPHQDIQALSRAHRIGQHKKVLCFQLVTRASAEERIMQVGRKKLALDHVLIQEMDADDADQNDLVSMLRHGASEIFEDSGDQDIVYDNASVDRLLDRSHMENTKSGEDKSAETQWSFARVWANDQGALQEEIMDESEEKAPDPSVWTKILQERERNAAAKAAAKADAYGRGRRARGNVDYNGDRLPDGAEGLDVTPAKPGRVRNGDDSDTDFLAKMSEPDDDADEGDGEKPFDGEDLDVMSEGTGAKRDIGKKKTAASPTFKRATLPQKQYVPANTDISYPPHCIPITNGVNCIACRTFHPVGSCPIKIAGVEYCNLCGLAHYGSARVCPHIQSETQVRAMLEALSHSNEPQHLVAEARRYLRGLKGNLVQMKKQKELKVHAAMEAQYETQYAQARGPVFRMPLGMTG